MEAREPRSCCMLGPLLLALLEEPALSTPSALAFITLWFWEDILGVGDYDSEVWLFGLKDSRM